MLNVNNFIKGDEYYKVTFYKIIKLLIYSYKRIIKERKFKITDNEDFLRNILVKYYLRIYNQKFQLEYYYFHTESAMINSDYRSSGFIDISVGTIGPSINPDDYYIFECKRLNGSNRKARAYVDEGINRFISGKYFSDSPFAGLIGFIQCGNLKKNLEKIENIMKEEDLLKARDLLENIEIEKSFKNIYYSSHDGSNILSEIEIYHIMFDYSEITN